MEEIISATVCFTGPRPKGILEDPYSKSRIPDYQCIVDELTELVYDLFYQGYIRFITGGAQGFDQLAFWAIHNAKNKYYEIINDVFIPFRGQERAWTKEGLFSQHEYNLMLENADNIIYCSESIDTNDFKQLYNALMYRNRCMVDQSKYIVGMYKDDSWRIAKKGGTAACLQYASKLPNRVLDVRSFGIQI